MTDFQCHVYTAAEPGIFVNSYLLESADGVVLIDANLLAADAEALAARLAALRKPLLAAFVTHPHPDHFNELPYIVSEMARFSPDAPLEWLVALGADPVAAEDHESAERMKQ